MTALPPKSRRDRPAKPPLSKAWIVDAALQILQEEGLEHVTMRRVAQALNTGPASLYVYIANTVALHAELLDQVLMNLTVPEDGDWQARLIGYLSAYGMVLARDSGLAHSALTARPTGRYYLRVHEMTASLLIEGGLSVASALWGADLLILHMTATAAEHARPQPTPQGQPAASSRPYPAELRAALLQTPDLPLLHTHTDLLFGGTPQQRYLWQLQVLITGLLHAPIPLSDAKEFLPHD